MNNTIENAYNFVIVFDVKDGNPNGDPDANPVDTINKLADSNIGVAVQKMLNGVGA